MSSCAAARRSDAQALGAARCARRIALALALGAVSLAGCETTAEKSAKLEKAAKRIAPAQQQGLSIAHASSIVKVLSATLVHGTEGTAAVLTLHNSSAKAIREVPISISLKDANGRRSIRTRPRACARR